MEKLIICLAPLGNVPTKDINPNIPISAKEIALDIKKCKKFGASIAHIHVRDKNESPTHDKTKYLELLDELKNNNIDIITQLSTGARGGPNTVESRGQMLDLNCEMASLAPSSSNFAKSVNVNSPELVYELAKKMMENNIKPEIEIFDLAMVSNAVHLAKKGVLKTPIHFNFVMNVPGSIPGTPKNLMFLVDSIPANSTWSVCGIGTAQIPMLTMAMAMGGHVRTGLEDSIYFTKDILATNEMLVERLYNIAKAMGREIASPDEARKILSLQ
jgi:3-keto-5-aminohexanoate cleavage enzyme